MDSQKSGKWKDALLGSGIPLENLVAEKLTEHGFQVFGEYSYTRRNEQDTNTEFSVDLLAKYLPEDQQYGNWGCLDLLIECKYRRRNTRWIFSPHPSYRSEATNPIIVNQALCTRRISDRYLNNLYEELRNCLRGTEFHSASKKDNPNEISHGLAQLHYAAPSLVQRGLHQQVGANSDEELQIQAVCSILVTTASLYILRRDAGLESFYEASDLMDVAEEVDALIVRQIPGPQLQEYSGELLSRFRNLNPRIDDYITSLGKLLTKAGITPMFDLYGTILLSSEPVLVLNIGAMDKRMEQLRDAVSYSANMLTRYATLKKEIRQTEAGERYNVFFEEEEFAGN